LNNKALLPFVFETTSFDLSCRHILFCCSTFVPPYVSPEGALRFIMQYMNSQDISDVLYFLP